MYGVSTNVLVKAIIPNKKIIIERGWLATTVDFEFTELKDDTVHLVIKNYSFKEKGDNLIQVVKASTGGFSTVLDGLKAYLEHNIKFNLIGNKYPKEVINLGL